MLILDFYVFQVVKMLSQNAAPRTKTIIYASYWTLSALALFILFILPIFVDFPRTVRSVIFAIFIGLFLFKLIASVFFLLDDIRRGIQWLSSRFNRNPDITTPREGNISRSVFLSWLGLAVGGGLYSSLLLGFGNKYNYKVKRVALSFDNLPPAFKGLKIVQLSDIHCGSFTDRAAVAKGVEMANSLKPDLIVFTGDLVNNKASEMDDYIDIFSKLDAPMGVYSIFGNHDYGDYHRWADDDEKFRNRESLKAIHEQMGWKLLWDEHVVLNKGKDNLALIGVQNWSALSNFPKYGNLGKAVQGTESIPFKILLSHDPTHWDGEIRPKFPDIDLTLAGHTHGMQFGVEIPGFRWSPVQYVYNQWMGLYEEGRQKLYINRGYGFIGYPGRVGILPEITLLEFA